MRIVIISLIIFLIGYTSFAQSLTSAKVPRIVPPSADASALGKFADNPVSRYTGVPEISIPVASINVRDINVPFHLRYHASGIRVEEEASWIGLGWSLEGIPTISRTIRGNDDFRASNGQGYIYSDPFPESNENINYNFLQKYCFGQEDGQPDVFFYNILGHSGKFFLKRKNQPGDLVQVILLSNNEKIKINYDEAREEWTVITNDGTTFILGTKEYTQSLQFPLNSFDVPYPDYHFGQIDPLDPRGHKTISTWYADRIISPLKEEVVFKYKTKPSENEEPFVSRSILSVSETRTDIRGVGARWSLDLNHNGYLDPNEKKKKIFIPIPPFFIDAPRLKEAPPEASCGIGRVLTGSFQVTYHVYPESITYKNGSIHFNTSNRQDISEYYDYSGTGGAKRTYSKPQKLDNIEIIGGQSMIVTQLEQGYFNPGSLPPNEYLKKRLKLDRVTESGTVEKKGSYIFSYLGDGANGANFSLPPKNSYARDHWGFYNNAGGNSTAGQSGNTQPTPTLIPAIDFERVEVAIVRSGPNDVITEIPDGEIIHIPGADRTTVEPASMLGTLNKIIYPTGGSTEYVYESNTFNLEEGATEPKDFFYTADQVEFEVPKPTSVTISSTLNCHNCFGNQDNSSCLENDIKDFSKAYFQVIRVADGAIVFHANYGDYYEKLDPAGHDFFNVITTPCGIQRTEQKTLLPGKYIINTYAIEKFKPHGYVSFTATVPVTTDLIRKGGGLRVKKIIDHDGASDNNSMIRLFDYSWIDAQGRTKSTGRLMTPPAYTYYGSINAFSGSGAASVCATFISDSYSNIPLGSSAQGNSIGYDKVTVSYGPNGENGKSIHYYMNDPEDLPDFTKEPFFPNSPTVTHSPSNGLLLKEEFYTSLGVKVREVLNGYNKETGPEIKGVMTRSFNGCSGNNSAIQFRRYAEPSEWWYLSTTYEKTFDVQDPLGIRGTTKTTTYAYNNFHKQVTEILSTKSTGEAVSEKLFYPFDVKTPELAVMYDETNANYKHIHDAIIKREVKVNNEITSGTVNNFKYYADLDRVLLNTQDIKLNGGPYETDLLIDKYDDQGNILQSTDKSGIPMAFIWGHHSTLLIAEASNATWDQIFHTSFEDEVSQTVTNAKTGIRYHEGDYTFIPPDYFNPAPNSIISYWYWEDGEWKYERQPYPGGTVVLDKGERIDEVRVYPAKAKLTSYTHDLLHGPTSITDENDQTTYYQFDKLGRLKVVRDFKGDIIKHYDHQYKK